MTDKNYTRRSHTVSKAYLKGFADENDRLLCLRKDNTSAFPISISDASVNKDFYALPGHPVRPDAFEETLGRFESGYPRWRSRLEDRKTITGVDRLTFAGYLAFQALRGQAFNRAAAATEKEIVLRLIASFSSEEMQKWLIFQGYSKDVETAQLVQHKILTGEIELELGSRAFVQHIDQEVNAVQGHLVNRKWQYVLFSKDSLITGDEPISLLPKENAVSTDIYLTLENPNLEILMPLSRKIGLRITSPIALSANNEFLRVENGDYDDFAIGTPEDAKSFNDTVIGQSQTAVFAHTDDSDLLDFLSSR